MPKKVRYARFRWFDSEIRAIERAYTATKAARDTLLRHDGASGHIYREVGPSLNRALRDLTEAGNYLYDFSGRPSRKVGRRGLF